MVSAILLDLFGTVVAYGDVVTGTRLAWEGIYGVLSDLQARSGQGDCPSYDAFVLEWEAQFQIPLSLAQDVVETPFTNKILRLFASYGLTQDRGAAACAVRACLDGWDAHLFLPDDTIPALDALRPLCPVALVSNFDHPPYVRALLDRLSLAPLFDAIIISGDVRIDKPDPRIFWQVLRQLDCSPDDAIHVGDSLISDIAGAQAAGCRPVLIDRKGRHLDFPLLRVESLAELPALIRDLDRC